MQLVVFQVNKSRSGVERITVGQHDQLRVARQGGAVDFHHVRARAYAVEIIFTFAVGNRVTAVFHVHAHAGNAPIIGILDPVAVAVDVDLTDDRATFGEDPALQLNFDTGLVAHGSGSCCLGGVDAIATQGAGTDFQAVGQGGRRAIRKGSERKTQLRAVATVRVGDRRAIKSGTVLHVQETKRQLVHQCHGVQGAAADVLHAQGVIDQVQNLGGTAGCRFLYKQSVLAGDRINRYIHHDQGAVGRHHKITTVGS